eukprot:6183690-Pleurochrysis_carterae.AAC.2
MSHIGGPPIHPPDSTDPCTHRTLFLSPAGRVREHPLRMSGARGGAGIATRYCALPCVPLERDRVRARTGAVPHAAPVCTAMSQSAPVPTHAAVASRSVRRAVAGAPASK